MSWFLPPGNSTFAGDIDFLYYMILVITGIAFFVVEGGLVWFIIKYRRRPGQKAYYTHGNMTAEVVWTTIPAVTLVIIGIMSGGVWKDVRGRNSVPPGALELGLVGTTGKTPEFGRAGTACSRKHRWRPEATTDWWRITKITWRRPRNERRRGSEAI